MRILRFARISDAVVGHLSGGAVVQAEAYLPGLSHPAQGFLRKLPEGMGTKAALIVEPGILCHPQFQQLPREAAVVTKETKQPEHGL